MGKDFDEIWEAQYIGKYLSLSLSPSSLPLYLFVSNPTVFFKIKNLPILSLLKNDFVCISLSGVLVNTMKDTHYIEKECHFQHLDPWRGVWWYVENVTGTENHGF